MKRRVTWFAIGVFVGAILLSSVGCCTAEVKESVKVWRDDYAVLEELVVPDPNLPPTHRAKVSELKKKMRVHLDKLAEEVGVAEAPK